MSKIPGSFGVPRSCKCYAALSAGGPLVPHTIDRRAATADDVVIGVKFAGICHSDIHQVISIHFSSLVYDLILIVFHFRSKKNGDQQSFQWFQVMRLQDMFCSSERTSPSSQLVKRSVLVAWLTGSSISFHSLTMVYTFL
jgi:hypothetical protein